MATPALLTSKNRLTPYAFACGYLEQKSTNHAAFRRDDLYTEMYELHGVYFVRQFDWRPDARIFQVFHKAFSTLRQARNCFGRQPGILKRP